MNAWRHIEQTQCRSTAEHFYGCYGVLKKRVGDDLRNGREISHSPARAIAQVKGAFGRLLVVPVADAFRCTHKPVGAGAVTRAEKADVTLEFTRFGDQLIKVGGVGVEPSYPITGAPAACALKYLATLIIGRAAANGLGFSREVGNQVVAVGVIGFGGGACAGACCGRPAGRAAGGGGASAAAAGAPAARGNAASGA